MVILDDNVDSLSKKLEQLKKAPTDPLFMADLQEIENDFNSIDSETL